MPKASQNGSKASTKALSEGFFSKAWRILSSDTSKFIIGLCLCAIGVFVLVSEVSFLINGKDDFNLLTKGFSDIAEDTKGFTNICSALGAKIANAMINNWFGIPSLLVPIFLFIVGHRLCNPDTKYSILKHFVFCFFVMIWTSVLLGAVVPNAQLLDFIRPGGLHGIIAANYMKLLVGPVGLALILAVTMIIYLAVTVASFVPKVQQWMNLSNWKKPEIDDAVIETEPTDGATDAPFEVVDIPETDGEGQEEEQPEEPQNPYATQEDEPEEPEEPEKPAETSEKEKVTADGEPTFEVSLAKGEGSEQVKQQTAAGLVEKHGKYDPTLELPHYKLPTFDLLKDYGQAIAIDSDEQQENKRRIKEALESYHVFIQDIKATVGPTITLYEIVPVAGTKISRIRGLGDDIAMSIAAIGIRIIAPMPGKGTIGIEVPNKKAQTVSMLSVLASKRFQESTMDLPIALGKTITDEVFMVDLCKLPHLLVAGATGQGKSVGLNAIIASLLYKKHPSQLKIVLVDPKKTEFSIYSDIDHHFLAKLDENEDAVITDVEKVIRTLQSVCKEMDARNDLLKKAHVRNIKEYNEKFVNRELNPDNGHRYLPYMVVIIDEYGDLIMTAGKEVESPITRIAAVARAAGIHMVIATQRPSANVVTGLIKANFPARMAFKVASMVDSRTILDASGANQLIGRGDMLFLQGSEITRVQCAFIDTPEVQNVCDFIRDQQGYSEVFALPEPDLPASESGDAVKGVDLTRDRDPFFNEVARTIVLNGDASVSMIQRKFSIGFNRAGRLMDQMEAAGIVGPSNGSKKRDIYIATESELENLINNL